MYHIGDHYYWQHTQVNVFREDGESQYVKHNCEYEVAILLDRSYDEELCDVRVVGLPKAGSAGRFSFRFAKGDILTVGVDDLTPFFKRASTLYSETLPCI